MKCWLFLSFLAAGCGAADATTIEGALAAYRQDRVADAEAILGKVIVDPKASQADRAAALVERARIGWLIDRDFERASRDLTAAEATGHQACAAAGLRARILAEAKRAAELLPMLDGLAARCSDPAKRDEVTLLGAGAALDMAAAPNGGEAVRTRARALLQATSEDGRTGLAGSRLSLELALASSDPAAALKAWKDYFWLSDTDTPQALGGMPRTPSETFSAALAADAPIHARLELVDLLIRAGFAREARRFADLRQLSARAGPDPLWRKAAAYLAEREKFERLILESYRRQARGGKAADFERAYAEAGKRLMTAAGLSGDSKEGLQRAYGLFGQIGKTEGHPSVHIGHLVRNERREVDQYGNRGQISFIAIDNMISNGYESWLWDGYAANGGWTSSDQTVVQVRPEYTSGPLRALAVVGDSPARKEQAAKQSERDAQDLAALRGAGVAYLPGLALRLRLQAADQVAAKARRLAGVGGDFRRAFLEEFGRATYQHSIFLHEGRHALDRKLVTGLARMDDANLEYRAKLSELALADYPRLALYNIDDPTVGDGSPHGKANARLLAAYAAWIEANRESVAGFDEKQPALVQIAKLSDDQIRAIARALDPIAR